MPRIGNARTIADIEYVIEPPSAGSAVTSWQSHGVQCSRDQHRFSGQSYAFAFEILELRFEGASRQRWHVVIVSELWKFNAGKADPRATKSLKVLQGKASDVLAWMRRCRDQKLAKSVGRQD